MNNIILMIKGFFMGIANIIPGVSGGTLAITMGIYEDLIETISHFFSRFKKNMLFILPIGVGALISIILGSKIISYCLDRFPLPTILFFIGLILGGIPLLYKKIKGNLKSGNISIFLLTFFFIIFLMFLKTGKEVSFENMALGNYFMLFLVGIIAAATMIIPGISGSFMLMVFGYYNPILDTINALTSFQNVASNLLILLPFGIGIIVGIVLIAKMLEFLFQKFEVPAYFGIIGFVFASVIGIFFQTEGLKLEIVPLIIGMVLFSIGFFIARKLGDQ